MLMIPIPAELAMVETFGAHYVSLHVRVSNQAAIRLYRDTLGFKTEKTETKYYADGEDAFGMRLELSYIREQLQEAAEDEDGEPVDEGEPVGDVGKAEDGKGKPGDKKKKKDPAAKKEEKVKVKVGRGLGVGELVERVESKAP